MKKLFQSLAFLICVLVAISLASCELIEGEMNRITDPLNQQISALEGRLTELNGQIVELEGEIDSLEGDNAALKEERAALEAEKAALESEKAALEAEKAALEEGNAALESDNAALKENKEALEAEMVEKGVELECAKGNHVIVEGGEYTYTWQNDLTQCEASFFCQNCESEVSSYAISIDTNENGEPIAGFGDFAPPTVFKKPIFTGVSFNSDSEAYDAETNTFTISESNPLVITFTGQNLNNIVQDYSYMLGVHNGNWVFFDYIPNSMNGILNIGETSMTVTFTHYFAGLVEARYGSLGGFGIFGSDGYGINETILGLNMAVKQLPVDEDGYMLVSDAQELEGAIKKGGMIRLANDIESENGFEIKNVTIIDLAGYDLKVTGDYKPTFWVLNNLTLTDSVGGSKLYKSISVNSGTLIFGGAIEIEYNDIQIRGSNLLDLSGYTGGEIYLYFGSFENVILPDGYAFFNYDNEGETTDFATAKEYVYGYVRPVEQMNT